MLTVALWMLLFQAASATTQAAEMPPRQKEYQVVLLPELFQDRNHGVKAFFKYLEKLEDGKQVKRFTYKKKSGKVDAREVTFLDTRGRDLAKAGYAVRYRRWLDEEKPAGELTVKHNAPTEQAALAAPLSPSPAYLEEGKSRAKVEHDLYEPGNAKFGYSVTLYGKHFRQQVTSAGDFVNVAAVGRFFPGLVAQLELAGESPLTATRHEFRWAHDEIALKFAGESCQGTLLLLYRTKKELDEASGPPQRIEFSWRLKEGEKHWQPEVFQAADAVSRFLWEDDWAEKPAAKP